MLYPPWLGREMEKMKCSYPVVLDLRLPLHISVRKSPGSHLRGLSLMSESLPSVCRYLCMFLVLFYLFWRCTDNFLHSLKCHLQQGGWIFTSCWKWPSSQGNSDQLQKTKLHIYALEIPSIFLLNIKYWHLCLSSSFRPSQTSLSYLTHL